MVVFLEESEFTPIRTPRRNKRRVSGQARGEDRPFIGWDGEGWTDHVCTDPSDCRNEDGRCKHHYYLFGCSTGEFVSSRSLGTIECFDLMLRVKAANPHAIHVAFSFKYDIDMMFRDVAIAGVRYLVKKNRMHWRGYNIEVLPGKWLQVTKNGLTCRIYDLFSFFASSFVNALKKWGVGTPEELLRIEEGKAGRSSFSLDSLESDVIPYWRKELELLVQLSDSLRDILYAADIRPSRWHGPGAVADYLFRENKTKLTKPAYEDIPTSVLDAGQYAYAGGRFEAFKIGLHDGPIYSADINSAYPYAMSLLPNLATGQWVRVDSHHRVRGDLGIGNRMGLYRVRYQYAPEARRAIVYGGMPAGAHYRYPVSGTIHFRDRNPGVWVHLPEYKVLEEQAREGLFSEFEVTDAWEYIDDGSYPFEWVRDIYHQRQVWKSAGNPAELAAKLGINSLYGKLAQRVGGREGVPTWHQLEWAGHITSTCRAMLYGASWRQYSDLVAYETDGIYSTAPLDFLPNGMGEELGQWKVEEYSGVLYLQSGVYWLRALDGSWKKPKTRGIPQAHMEFDQAYAALREKVPLRVTQTQFIRFGLADMRRDGYKLWRTWQQNEKEFSFGGHGLGSSGKRVHIEQSCKECAQGLGYHESLHTLMLSPKGFARDKNGEYRSSAPHYLPWRKIGQQSVDSRKSEILKRWGDVDV